MSRKNFSAAHPLLLFALHLPLLGASSSFCTPSADWSLEWEDTFDGETLDLTKWNVVTGTSPHPNVDDCYGDQCPPWAGCRAGLCTESNVYVVNGTATLRSDRNAGAGPPFTTAAITTRGKANWTWADGAYRLCVSAKLPGTEGKNNDGLWPAHWMLPDEPWTCDPDGGEIDVMEMVNVSCVPPRTHRAKNHLHPHPAPHTLAGRWQAIRGLLVAKRVAESELQ